MATSTAFNADRRNLSRVALTTVLGATLEWYDFFLYGTAAALVFAQLFFPTFDHLVGTLVAFATFTVGIAAGPVGGFVFGHFGDKLGRKPMLVITLLMMGISSFLIGVLPTYAAAGVLAPILLLVLRILTGIAIGGEWGGAALMVVESASERRRGFYGSLPGIGAVAGFVLSTGAFAAVNLLPEQQFIAWGWRLPFLASIALTAVGLYARLRILETATFRAEKSTGHVPARRPLVEALRQHPGAILLILGCRLGESVPFVIFAVFALTYARDQLQAPATPVLIGAVVAALVECATIPIFGALSDRIGRRPLYLGASLFLVAYAFPFFWLIDSRSMPLIWLALIVGLGIGHAPLYAVQPAFFSALFDTRVRSSGLGIAFSIGTVIAGGIAPLVATALLAWSGGAAWPIALYILAAAAITVVATWFTRETYRTSVGSDTSAALAAIPDGAAPAVGPTSPADPA